MDVRMRKSGQGGFTLIELMVVVAVIGILSMVAFPSYQDYVTRGRIPDATSNLANKNILMEQFFQDNRTYSVGGATPAPCVDDSATSKYFNFSCSGLSAAGYTLTATGKGAMTGFTFTIDQQGGKSTTAVPSGWTSATGCWVTKKDGSC